MQILRPVPRVQTFTNYSLAPSVEEMKVTDKSAIDFCVALYVGIGRTLSQRLGNEGERGDAFYERERDLGAAVGGLRETRETSSVRYRRIMKRRSRGRSVCELVEKAG